MPEESTKLESIKFAQESTKQIITLCTAIVTFIFGAVSVGALSLHGNAFWFACAILGFLLVSLLAGIFSLYALSGILVSKEIFASENPLKSAHYTRFGSIQFYTFVAAIALISVFILFWPEKAQHKIEITTPSSLSCQIDNSKLICVTTK